MPTFQKVTNGCRVVKVTGFVDKSMNRERWMTARLELFCLHTEH